jgi:hypothetical protein
MITVTAPNHPLAGLELVDVHAKHHAAFIEAEFSISASFLVCGGISCPSAAQSRLGS